MGKNPHAIAGDVRSIAGWGRSPGGRNGDCLQYFFFLGNPMDGGAWQATIHGVAKVRQDLVTNQPQQIAV